MQRSTLFIRIILSLFTACSGQVAPASTPAALTTKGDTVSGLGNSIMLVYQDRQQVHWFGSWETGLYRYDGNMIVNFTTKHGLPNNRIDDIKEDAAGNLIIVSAEGVSKYDGKQFFTLPVVKSNEWKKAAGDVWLKAPGKNGPYRYDGATLYQLEFPKHYLADDFYKAIPNPPYNPYEVYTIYEDSKGNVWFGTSNFGIGRFDGKTLSWLYEKHLSEIEGGGLFGIRSIIEDKDGRFWFCNTSYRYNILAGSVRRDDNIFINYKREIGIENITSPEGRDMIYFMSIVEDKKGDLWMLTYEQGVWRYDGKKLTHYAVKNGTKDITLYSIYKDRNDDLWLGTHENGAYKFNGTSFEQFRK